MVKVNGKYVEWKAAPNFVNDIQRQVLWKDERTGASFAILRLPKGTLIEEPAHGHPHANQITFGLSGELEFPDGTRMSAAESAYMFQYHAKNVKHGAFPKGTKVLNDIVYLHYWDGPDDWDDTHDG